MNYFLARDGQRYGPYTLEKLQEIAAEGRVAAGDLVWWEGQAGWVPASQVLPSLGPATPPRPGPSEPESPSPTPTHPDRAVRSPRETVIARASSALQSTTTRGLDWSVRSGLEQLAQGMGFSLEDALFGPGYRFHEVTRILGCEVLGAFLVAAEPAEYCGGDKAASRALVQVSVDGEEVDVYVRLDDSESKKKIANTVALLETEDGAEDAQPRSASRGEQPPQSAPPGPDNLQGLAQQFRGRKFGELILHHRSKSNLQNTMAAMFGTIGMLPGDGPDYVESWIDECNAWTHSPEFFRRDCGEALQTITAAAEARLRDKGIDPTSEDLFNMFQVIVFNFVYATYKHPQAKGMIQEAVGMGFFRRLLS